MLLGLAGIFAACNEDPEFYTLEDQPDKMHIQSSVDQLILNKGIANDPAITFTWSAQPSPISADDQVTYGIRFYAETNKDEYITDLVDVGEELSYTLTHEELNNIISRWVAAGQTVEVTAQVLSNVHNESKYVKPASSTVNFSVTGYERFPEVIYMHMTDEASGVTTVHNLTQRQRGTGVYEVTVKDLWPCTYHFTTTTEALPAYGQAEGEKMVYVTEGDVPEFIFEDFGTRTFIIDTNPDYNDCRVLDIIELPGDRLWIAGMGTSIGWNTNTAEGQLKMTGGPREPYIWSWTGQFYNAEDAAKINNDSPGQFKIGCGNGWSDPFIFASSADADPATDHTFSGPRYQDNGGDNKWLVRTTGKYTFSIYLLADDPHTTFEPAE